MSRVTVQLPSALREQVGGTAELELDAASVADALHELARRYPRLRRHLFADGGALREHVNVFVNSDDTRTLDGPRTPLADDDVVAIVPSIAGGAPERAAAGSATGEPATGPAQPELSAEELARYSRQLTLPELGRAGQEKLRRARVLIVGAGGLGSPAALYLGAAGVGTLGLVDFDDVDRTNLHRQVLYGESDVGRSKLDVAAERLAEINPHVHVVKHALRLTSENALDVLRDYDVVIDGSDNFPTRYLVNDACVLLGRPYVYGAILRFEGQASVFGAKGGPCYRCLFREPPPPGLVPSCAEAGVLGVLPGIIGSLQALEAIKLVTGVGEPLVGRLVILDTLGMRWREMRLRRNLECPVCGDEPTLHELIDYEEFCGLNDNQRTEEAEPEISVRELRERLEDGRDEVLLLDVRQPHELEIANLNDRGAVLIPVSELPDRLDELDRERDIVVFCRSGSRSAMAVRFLRESGFDRTRNLSGGILAWADEVDDSMRKY